MGLEGNVNTENMEIFSELGTSPPTTTANHITYNCDNLFKLEPLQMDVEGLDLQVLLQAQNLLKKSKIYKQIDSALQRAYLFRPEVYGNLTQYDTTDEEHVSSVLRDSAVSNLRFLNIFYSYSPSSFALAVNLLDRLLGRVKAQTKYLYCIATTCYYIAIKTQEEDVFIPAASELVKLSQSGCTVADLLRMERLILEKLQWDLNAVTPFTFMQCFFEVFADKEPRLSEPGVFNALVAKLEIIMCQFEFTKFKAETLALAVLSHMLQEMDLLGNTDLISSVLELQYYCQIADWEFLQCRGLIMDYLVLYDNRPSRLPRLQLQWTVSKRTMAKLKPSQRVLLDLEPIFEDEDLELGGSSSVSDDAGPFDSENESEYDKNRNLRTKFQCNNNLAEKWRLEMNQDNTPEVSPLQRDC